MLSLLALLTSSLVAPPCGQSGSHPGAFVTAADVARVRQAIATHDTWARWADELVVKAQAKQLSELPPLDRSWWETDRTKPWSETYPQVYHHTWIVPAHWADLARSCAWGGLLRPASKLTDKAKQVLLELANFTFEFEHYDVGLNYTVWVLDALEAYDILYDEFTPVEREKIDACFLRFLAALQKNDDYWLEHEPGGGLNNHYAWHKLGFLAVGLFYGRPELVDQAWDGPKGIEFLMRYGFTDDGLWTEGSIPYQLAATTPLVKAAELLENAGHARRLYRDETGDGRTLKSAYDALLPLLFPDRTLPTIGDCYGERPHLGQRSDWEILCRRFRDPRYAWLLTDVSRRSREALFVGLAELPAGIPPPQHSRLWPEHGYAALRSVEGTEYWTGKGWTVFANYSSNRVHENLDKLSIILYADGHLWLPDCEAIPSAEHSFSADIQKELNRQTLCHNTLLVDQRSQQFPREPLDLLEYQVLPEVKRLTIGDRTGRLYTGVSQMRTCLVRSEYVLDFFQVRAAESCDFDWLLHVDGESETSTGRQAPATGELGDRVPWNYVRSPVKLGQGNIYAETFRSGERRFRVDLCTSQPQEVIGCGFPRGEGSGASTIAMRVFRSKQLRQAWYAAIYRSGTDLDEPVPCQVAPGKLGAWHVTVQLNGRRFVHRIPQL